jgi:hypothetical protein
MGSSSRPRVRRGEGNVLQVRLELVDVRPTIWRLLLVSARASLLELHGVIQRALGRAEAWQHTFEVDGVRYFDPEEDVEWNTETVALQSLALHPGARLSHVVETEAEPWRHVLTVEQVSPRLVGQRIPVCVAGARAAPPDDVEGPARFQHLLAALEAPLDARTAELRDWLPADFDPDYVDLTAINAQLARLPKHRPA